MPDPFAEYRRRYGLPPQAGNVARQEAHDPPRTGLNVPRPPLGHRANPQPDLAKATFRSDDASNLPMLPSSTAPPSQGTRLGRIGSGALAGASLGSFGGPFGTGAGAALGGFAGASLKGGQDTQEEDLQHLTNAAAMRADAAHGIFPQPPPTAPTGPVPVLGQAQREDSLIAHMTRHDQQQLRENQGVLRPPPAQQVEDTPEGRQQMAGLAFDTKHPALGPIRHGASAALQGAVAIPEWELGLLPAAAAGVGQGAMDAATGGSFRDGFARGRDAVSQGNIVTQGIAATVPEPHGMVEQGLRGTGIADPRRLLEAALVRSGESAAGRGLLKLGERGLRGAREQGGRFLEGQIGREGAWQAGKRMQAEVRLRGWGQGNAGQTKAMRDLGFVNDQANADVPWPPEQGNWKKDWEQIRADPNYWRTGEAPDWVTKGLPRPVEPGAIEQMKPEDRRDAKMERAGHLLSGTATGAVVGASAGHDEPDETQAAMAVGGALGGGLLSAGATAGYVASRAAKAQETERGAADLATRRAQAITQQAYAALRQPVSEIPVAIKSQIANAAHDMAAGADEATRRAGFMRLVDLLHAPTGEGPPPAPPASLATRPGKRLATPPTGEGGFLGFQAMKARRDARAAAKRDMRPGYTVDEAQPRTEVQWYDNPADARRATAEAQGGHMTLGPPVAAGFGGMVPTRRGMNPEFQTNPQTGRQMRRVGPGWGPEGDAPKRGQPKDLSFGDMPTGRSWRDLQGAYGPPNQPPIEARPQVRGLLESPEAIKRREAEAELPPLPGGNLEPKGIETPAVRYKGATFGGETHEAAIARAARQLDVPVEQIQKKATRGWMTNTREFVKRKGGLLPGPGLPSAVDPRQYYAEAEKELDRDIYGEAGRAGSKHGTGAVPMLMGMAGAIGAGAAIPPTTGATDTKGIAEGIAGGFAGAMLGFHGGRLVEELAERRFRARRLTALKTIREIERTGRSGVIGAGTYTEGQPFANDPLDFQKALAEKDWIVITASNPHGMMTDDATNAAANAKLEKSLRAYGYIPIPQTGTYHDPMTGKQITETSFLVPRLKEAGAMASAEQFGQNSVLTPRGLLTHDGKILPKTGFDFNPPADAENVSTIMDVGPKGEQTPVPYSMKLEPGEPKWRRPAMSDYEMGGMGTDGSGYASPYSLRALQELYASPRQLEEDKLRGGPPPLDGSDAEFPGHGPDMPNRPAPAPQPVPSILTGPADPKREMFGRRGALGVAPEPASAATPPPIKPEDFAHLPSFDVADVSGEARLKGEINRVVNEQGLSPKRVVTWEDTQRIAAGLGLHNLNPKDVRLLDAPRMLAIRNIVSSNVETLDKLYHELGAATLDPARKSAIDAEIGQIETQNTALLGRFIRGRALMGRNLNALKILANRTTDPFVWLTKAENMMQQQGKTLSAEASKMISDAAKTGDPAQIMAAINRAVPTPKQNTAIAVWKAGLLTSPVTHMKNLASNTVMAGLELAKDAPATVADRFLSAFTGQRTKDFAPMTDLGAMGRGAAKGLREAKLEMQGVPLGETLNKFDLNRELNSGSPILDAYVNGVFRSLRAEDRVYRMSALERALEEVQRTQRGKPITDETMAEAIKVSEEASKYATFNNQSPLAKAAAGFKRPLGAVGDVIIPFAQTPANVASATLDYSPFGFIKSVRDGVKAAQGSNLLTATERRALQRSSAEAFGRAATGTAIITTGYLMAKAGILTGARPQTASERQSDALAGKQENAIHLPGSDNWRSVGGISPFGNLLALGANLHELYRDPDLSPVDAALGGLASVGTTVTEQSFLSGLQQAQDAMHDRKSLTGAAERQVATVVPSGLGAIARTLDPTVRQPRTFGDAVKARIPGLSKQVPAAIDQFGRERTRGGSALSPLYDITQPRRDETKQDVLRAEIARDHASVPMPKRRTGESDAAYETRERVDGQMLQGRLSKLWTQPRFQAAPPALRGKMISGEVRRFRAERARAAK